MSEEQRDNLNIGLTLAEHYHHGCVLDDLLIEAIGYTPGDPWPTGDREYNISRLRQAQSLGLRKYALRQPGYFTIHAQPFGNIFVYKAVWYTWLNPATGSTCTVLVCNTDLVPMRRRRDRDLATRTRNTRAVRAADNTVRQDRALVRGNTQGVRNIQAGMVQDGTLVEVITGLLGIPYIEVPELLDVLSQGNPYGAVQYEFTRKAQQARELERRLTDLQAAIVNSLSRYIATRQGLPQNARQLALQDARDRLANLP